MDCDIKVSLVSSVFCVCDRDRERGREEERPDGLIQKYFRKLFVINSCLIFDYMNPDILSRIRVYKNATK